MEPKEVTFDREYDAPIEEVWEAWTDAEKVKQWWGPQGVVIPECSIDLRVGGEFNLVMQAGEAMGDVAGTRWPMKSQFTAVEKPHKLAYTSKAWTEEEESTEIETTSELTLSEEGGKTKLHLRSTVTSSGPRAGQAVEGMKYGFNMQFDKLGKFLEK
jgi:uncharacterized protein YndB with AHSA1/START domain